MHVAPLHSIVENATSSIRDDRAAEVKLSVEASFHDIAALANIGTYVLPSMGYRYPWLRHLFADSGYAGDKLRQVLKRTGEWTIELIKRSDFAQGFEILPRRGGRRTNFRMARSLPQIGKGFRDDNRSAVAWTSSLTSTSSQDGSQELEIERNHYESNSESLSGEIMLDCIAFSA